MVPLNPSVRDRSPGLEELVLGWWNTGRELEVLDPRDWFNATPNPGDFGWLPATVAADAIIDQCCEALHNIPHCYHVFAIPLLMTN
jgi:hypothetical protein